jgi:predicted metal-binding membrane protein
MLKITCLRARLLLLCALAACSPDYNWRQVQDADAAFAVLFPARPSSHAREINLDGIRTNMSMTAAEVNGVLFAVGSSALPDAAQVQPALDAMKTAMVRNIGGTIASDKTVPGPAPYNEVIATGKRNGRPVQLTARFAARKLRVYQAVVIGAPQDVPAEAIDTFLSSFKPGG